MSEPIPCLVVAEEEGLLEQVRAVLLRAGLSIAGRRVRAAEALAALGRDPPLVCVVEDRACADSQAFALAAPPDTLLVLVCDPAREDHGAEAMSTGFADYLLRDNLARLGPLVRRWLATPSYRDVFHHTSDAVAVFEVLPGPRFLVKGLNPAAERLFGAAAEDAAGKPVQALLPPPVAEVVLAGLWRAAEGAAPAPQEERWELPAGTRWLEVLHVPGRRAGRGPRGLAAVWRDVTHRKGYERALIDREEMFRRLVETTNVIPWEADPRTGRFTYVGPQAARRFGHADAEWLREGFWAEQVHPDDRDKAAQTRLRLAATASEYECEYRVLTQSGEVVWVEDLGGVALDREGRLLLRGFFVDITALKQAEEEVRLLNAELERRVAERTAQLAGANRELEAFSYSVSHDLRAPLRAIDGFSKALLEDYGPRLDEDGRDMLGRIRAASQRMGELIDDLLLLSRVSRSEMRMRRVDLSELARTIARALSEEAPHRQVEWAIAPGLTAVGDPALLRVVLENLLGNAWKYTGKAPRARIEFGRLQGDDEEFFVRDDGAGFDPVYAPKLFKPFQRLHPPEEFEGHGIGLATVQRIIHRHRGRVRGEGGGVGNGATFYFTL